MDNDELLQLDKDDTDDWILPVLLIVYILTQRQPRLRTNRSNTGQGYVDNLLNCRNPNRIHTQLRMHLETFYLLRDWLEDNTNLGPCHISIKEKLLIFIFICSSGVPNRDAQEHFNRGPRVISK
jgi:hypothetical protein